MWVASDIAKRTGTSSRKGIGQLDLEPAIVVSDIEKQLIATDLNFLAGKQRLLAVATHCSIYGLEMLIIFAPPSLSSFSNSGRAGGAVTTVSVYGNCLHRSRPRPI